MAIQTRRGSYNDFDPEKLLPGEWGTVQSDDPNSTDGQSVYMCFSPGQTKRMATYDDMAQNIDNAVEDVKNQFAAGMQAATESANTAAASANQSASEAIEAADRANTVSDTIQSAVEGTLINDMSASSLTVYSSQKIESDFRKKSDTIDILHGGTGATTAEQARENLQAAAETHSHDLSSENITGVNPISKGGTGGSDAKTARANLGLGKQLWSGSWSTGKITVPDLTDYVMYYLDVSNSNTLVPAFRENSSLRGSSGYFSSNDYGHLALFDASVSGNTLTYGHLIDISISRTGSLGFSDDLEVVAIYGVF